MELKNSFKIFKTCGNTFLRLFSHNIISPNIYFNLVVLYGAYVRYYCYIQIIIHRAEMLVSLIFDVRADINQMPKVSQQYPFLGTEQDSTFLISLAVPNNADF